MARGIQQNDVFGAADALLLAGDRPTIERVRQKIGRGSPNTVSPMLDLWFTQLGTRIRDPKAFSPAASVPDPVQQAAKHFWETALTIAREKEIAVLAEAAMALGEREAKVLAAEAAVSRRSDEISQRAADLDTALSLAQDRISDALNAAAAAKSEAEVSRHEAQRLQSELRQLRESEERARAFQQIDRAAAEEERKTMEARLDSSARRAASEIDRARSEARKLTNRLEILEEGHRRDSVEINALRLQIDDAEARADEIAKSVNDTEAALKSAEAKFQDASDIWETRLTDKQAELEQAKVSLQRHNEQTELLRSLLGRLPHTTDRKSKRLTAKP